MKTTTEISRRRFLAVTGAAAAFSVVPAHVIGAAGQTTPSNKLNLGFVGVGAQGMRVMVSFLKEADVQGLAVCDVNRQSGDYPQWGKDEFAKLASGLIGSGNWQWLSPNQFIALTHTSKGYGGMGGREPARQIVEALAAKQTRSGTARKCKAYADFREMLEKEKDLDAVVVGTPDHAHALVSVAAMKKGKHVYCQKPMTHTVAEAWRMGEVAAQKGVSTQVAVGNQASEDTRRLCEWVWGGVIGNVREVVNWSSRPFWPQGIERPRETMRVPSGLDWDLWLGPAPQRPFHQCYLPFVWRGWHDFGCGALGDMGCYSFDTIYRVLKLGAVESVEASCTERYPETYPQGSIIHLKYPARGDMRPVKLSWYDGGLMPPNEQLHELKGKVPAEGLLFIGERGSIVCGFTGTNPKLLPEGKDFKEPAKTLTRSLGNEREWLDACKGGTTKPGANFVFSAQVTEGLLLANVGLRTGEKLVWDAGKRSTGSAAADKLIGSEYRKGWTL